MKRLTCEMCGSTDLIKQDGVFVCQSCGCKYSVEEAKKMMIEGTVDVTGSTVKVDNAQKLENLRRLASRAKDVNDSETAEKYYQQILLEEPNDWEAQFYTIYYACHNIKIAQLGSAANRVSNCIENVFKLIKDTIDEPEEQKNAYMEVAGKVLEFKGLLVANAKNNLGSDVNSFERKFREWVVPSMSMVVTLGDNLITYFEDYDAALMTYDVESKSAKSLARMYPSMKNWNTIIENRIIMAKRKQSAAYWEEHAEEKEKLESELTYLKKQIEELEVEIKTLPENELLVNIENNIATITNEKNSLGLFKGAEKRALQEQINELNKKHSNTKLAKERAIKPYEDAIRNHRSRISEIESLLEGCGDSLEEYISSHFTKDTKVHAVKWYRNETGADLREAKAFCDKVLG